MHKTNLFDDFPKTSAKEWKQKIQFDLNGADYNDSLVWESPEGIKVKPFYHAEERENAVLISETSKNKWNIGQAIYVSNAKSANKKALELIGKGVDSIYFIIPSDAIAIDTLCTNLVEKKISFHFAMHFLSLHYIQELKAFLKDQTANYFLNIDPIGNLARTGNWFYNREKDFKISTDLIGLQIDQLFSIDMSLYQNAGANMVQQLAYALAHANEYLNQLPLKGESKKFTFKVSLGSNYFFEIAKLKALRVLWRTLSSEYGISQDCHIIAINSRRNKTLYEYNANMIRSTIESMAAILGGADTIFNMPYDALYHKDNEFGSRIAKNQLLLLKEESYFKSMDTPTKGSYYIDSLTEQLAAKALDLFKNIEAGDGFLNQLKKHIIQKKIKESAQKEQDLFDSQKLILVGTNKFKNLETKMKHEIELYPFVKNKIRKTLVEPILEKRLSEVLEKRRLLNEQRSGSDKNRVVNTGNGNSDE